MSRGWVHYPLNSVLVTGVPVKIAPTFCDALKYVIFLGFVFHDNCLVLMFVFLCCSLPSILLDLHHSHVLFFAGIVSGTSLPLMRWKT